MPNLGDSYGYRPSEPSEAGSLYRGIAEENTRAQRLDRLKRLGYMNAGTPYGPETSFGDARRASRSAIAIRKLQELRDAEAERLEPYGGEEPSSGLEELGKVFGWDEPKPEVVSPRSWRPKRYGFGEPF